MAVGDIVGVIDTLEFDPDSTSIPAISLLNPRTGLYSAYFYTPSSSIRWGRLTYTVTDPLMIAFMRGKTVNLNCWTRQYQTFSGAVGSYWWVKLSESGGTFDTTGNLASNPWQVYFNRALSVVADLALTAISIVIYWYKSGGGHIYPVNIDDVSLEVDGKTGLYLPTVQTNPATEVT